LPAAEPGRVVPPRAATRPGDDTQAISDLRNLMYANVGLVRNEAGLREALARIDDLNGLFPQVSGDLRNLLVVGRLIAQAALARTESRGSHYRTDYLSMDEALAKRSFTHFADAV
ncbi:MAG: L-aspartate oxidase, partial [Vulcanimicrobiaceae bacterium]